MVPRFVSVLVKLYWSCLRARTECVHTSVELKIHRGVGTYIVLMKSGGVMRVPTVLGDPNWSYIAVQTPDFLICQRGIFGGNWIHSKSEKVSNFWKVEKSKK